MVDVLVWLGEAQNLALDKFKVSLTMEFGLALAVEIDFP
ncbi:hypothetical protein A2U01_0081017, partial [Trifolium medium]|nr:hypothetical protein [Trifolium medium]